MSSPLSSKTWLIVIVVNIVVSAITALIVVRIVTLEPDEKFVNATVGKQAVEATPATPAPGPMSADAAGTATAVQDTAPTATPSSADARASATATPERSSPDASSATPETTTAASTEVNVRISAVLYPGQRQREVVVIVNEGPEVEMQGWTLASSNGITFTFGNITLFRDSFISLHTTSGSDVPTDLFWNRTEPAWKSGDKLTLAAQGQTVATFTVK